MKTRGVMVLPGGTVVRHHDDDGEVKALAVRLGVYAQVAAGLRQNVPRPASAALCRDGNTLFAIVALSGWDEPKENGWLAIGATPATGEGAYFLGRVVGNAIDVTESRGEEADRSWPN